METIFVILAVAVIVGCGYVWVEAAIKRARDREAAIRYMTRREK